MSKDRKTGRGFADLHPFRAREEDRSESARKRRLYREDFTPQRLAANLRLARDAFAAAQNKMKRSGASRDPGPLPGVLDQDAAIEARLWFERVSLRTARRHARRYHRARRRYHIFLLTIIPASGVVPVGRLATTDLAKLRKVMQRYARSLPEGSFFGGMLEPDYIIDYGAGLKHWQWHGHFIVVVSCRGDRAAARNMLRKAFPVKCHSDLGIYRPFDTRVVKPSRGGLTGTAEYIGKALQVHGLHRKLVTVSAETGKRYTVKYQLEPAQLAEWAAFAAGITAYDLMVWSGYRRYGDGLSAISGHGGGGRHKRLKR